MRKTVAYAFHHSIPILIGFFPVGLAYGLLMQQAGYNFLWSGACSLFVLAGSLQFLMVTFFAGGVSLATVAVLALLLALFIRRRPRRFDGRALLLLLPLLAPVLWTLALSNHASDHTYFTYRNLCGAFFALFALPALLAPDQTPSL